ncbi:MAG: hydrogenase iron-sulfur subunit [Candidatus Eremiobacteraeota bacterium]|nr:hydrogenase iron-sulfur subunit [Candidatus Eremiobacteraeota bacterium]
MKPSDNGFEPRIVAFLCKWCAGAGADLAGVSRLQYAPNAVPIMFNCTGRLDPTFVLKAFTQGADGVFIGGCHPGDCHYLTGNYNALKRVILLEKVLVQFGINPRRLRLEWVSASEGNKFARVMNEFSAEIKKLGPLEKLEVSRCE